MKNQLKEKATKLSAKLLKSVAHSTSASACWYSLYQPVEPKGLKNK